MRNPERKKQKRRKANPQDKLSHLTLRAGMKFFPILVSPIIAPQLPTQGVPVPDFSRAKRDGELALVLEYEREIFLRPMKEEGGEAA
jgi:hypothetical protein